MLSIASAKYLIICDALERLGDISCGFKIASDIHTRMHIAAKHIFIATNQPHIGPLFNRHQFHVINSTHENIEKIIVERGIVLQIIAPTSSERASHKASTKIPAIAFMEYGFPKNKAFALPEKDSGSSNGLNLSSYITHFSLGLSNTDIGIIIDPDLKEWGFSQGAAHPDQRLMQLRNCTMGLQKAILTKEAKPSNIQVFAQSSLLYFGYTCTKVTFAYIKKIVDMNASNDKNIVFVVPGFDHKMVKLAEILQQRPVVEIEVAHVPENSQQIQRFAHFLSTDGSKKIKIIVGSFGQQDIHYLLKAAERETVVTGDQSLSEAISANMNFVYAAPEHKTCLSSFLVNFGYPVVQDDDDKLTISFPPCALEQSNASIASSRDYFANFESLLQERLQTLFQPLTSFIASAIDKQTFRSSLELDQTYLIERGHLSWLNLRNIDSSTNSMQYDRQNASYFSDKSNLPQFNDFVFQYILFPKGPLKADQFILRKVKDPNALPFLKQIATGEAAA